MIKLDSLGITCDKNEAVVSLTAEEAGALESYIWLSFIPFIQDKDNDVDNLDFVQSICNIWAKCHEFGQKEVK